MSFFNNLQGMEFEKIKVYQYKEHSMSLPFFGISKCSSGIVCFYFSSNPLQHPPKTNISLMKDCIFS